MLTQATLIISPPHPAPQEGLLAGRWEMKRISGSVCVGRGVSMINKIVYMDAVVTTKAFEECRVKERKEEKVK